jgi:hypothetical protein
MLMKITKDENIVLFKELFANEVNYNRFAPFFSEFVKENAGIVECLPGALWPSGLTISDSLKKEFELWLKSKGVVVQLT